MGGPDMAPHTPQTLGAPPGNPWRASIPPQTALPVPAVRWPLLRPLELGSLTDDQPTPGRHAVRSIA
jgi:hypothetical protein